VSDPGAVPVVVVGSTFVADGSIPATGSDGMNVGDRRGGC
jgi:hypothetical protein